MTDAPETRYARDDGVDIASRVQELAGANECCARRDPAAGGSMGVEFTDRGRELRGVPWGVAGP